MPQETINRAVQAELRRWFRRQAVGFVVAFVCLAAGLLVFVLANHAAERRHVTEARDFTIRLCRINNITKATIRNGVHRSSAFYPSPRERAIARSNTDAMLVLLDCDATFRDHGAAVPLAPAVTDAFLRDVASGWVPLVRHGQIVGRRRPESGGIADF